MSKNTHMIQLDGLRAIAVAFVIFGHYTMLFPAMVNADKIFAYSGVDLFFVLSGFLITLILIRTKDRQNASLGDMLKKFYIRRFLRIFPLYYFVIAIGLILIIPNARHDLIYLLSYTTNFLVAFNDGGGGYYTPLWSLGVEEQFYIFFPIMLLLTPKKHIVKLGVILVAVGLFSRLGIYISHRLIYHKDWVTYALTPCCLDSFGFGILLSYLVAYKAETTGTFLKKYALLFWVPTLIAVGIFIAGQTGRMLDLRLVTFRFLISITCFWIIGTGALGQFGGYVKSILESKPMVYLGKISYGLYVYHFFVFYLYDKVAFTHSLTPGSFICTMLVYLITTILISSLSFKYFENPINALKSRFEY